MNVLRLDWETKSAVDLKKHGVYVYAVDPTTDILMASYQLGGGVKRWRPPAPCPPEIIAHIEAGGTVQAFNAAFERLIWKYVAAPRHDWPVARTKQFRCTAATAAAMALPRSLEGLGEALGLPIQKDKEGTRLIRLFSIPRRKDGLFNHPEDFQDEFERFHDYCDTDVQAEAEADRRLVPLSAEMQEFYVIDQQINDRGIRIDRRSVRAALELADRAKALLDREMKICTNGYVTSCAQVGKLAEWVSNQGVYVDSVAKAEIEDLLDCNDLPEHVEKALRIRQEAAKAAVRKLQSFLYRVSDDDRIRGWRLFHGASTGRASSVKPQLHNLIRPRKEYGDAHLDTSILFEAFRAKDPEWLKALYGPELGRTMHLIADATRGFLWAAPGHDLIAVDYSGIEGAVAAWFAGEDWKLTAMSRILADPDNEPDMYRRAAAGIFNTTVEEIGKKDPRRQVGKVSELSLQYQGSVAAFRSMARNYSLKIEPVYDPVWAAASPERREQALKRYARCVERGEATTKTMSQKSWLAADLVKAGWRAAHPAIVGMWKTLEDATREAVRNPGQQVAAGRVTYMVTRGFLWLRLPSGRCLAYGTPRLRDQVWAKRRSADGSWPDAGETMPRAEAEALARQGLAKIEGTAPASVTVLGVEKNKYIRYALYGGLDFENVVQAIAFDILAGGIRIAEANGYPVVLDVHDEIVTEVPRGWGDVKAFEKLICELPPWAAGLPLAAGGWRGKRYRKE